MQKYLEILWIWFWLSKVEIKKVWRDKASRNHPDKHFSNKEMYERKMMEINWAYWYIMENYNDYVKKINEIRHTESYFFDEWLYIYYVLKDYELALKKFDKSLEINPKYVNSYFIKAKYYENISEYEKALSNYSRVLEYNPKYSNAYTSKLNLLHLLWRENEIEELNDVHLLNFWWFYSLYKRWIVCYNNWNNERASQMLKRSRELNPNFYMVQNTNNNIQEYNTLRHSNNLPEELKQKFWISSINKNKTCDSDNYLKKATNFINEHILLWKKCIEDSSYDEAIKNFDFLLNGPMMRLQNELSEDLVTDFKIEIYNSKWLAFYKQWKYKEANKMFDLVLSFSSNIIELLSRANTLFEEWNYKNAILLLDRIVVLDSKNVDAYIVKWNSLKKMWDWYKALQLYSKALTINPNNNRAIEELNILKNKLVSDLDMSTEDILEVPAFLRNH